MAFRFDKGTLITVRLTENGEPLPIPGGALVQIRLEKPNGRVVTKTATIVGDGSQGEITYTLVAGDVDLPGKYFVQGYIESGGGGWSSVIGSFDAPNILRNAR